VNWVRYHRIEPFLTSGGGFLYFDRSMFKATHFNFTAQLGGGVQLLTPGRHRSFDIGCEYHHISNANLGNVNHGMDSVMLFAGFSFLH
jgi:Lipid A 3-O-deacylase (PagL)